MSKQLFFILVMIVILICGCITNKDRVRVYDPNERLVFESVTENSAFLYFTDIRQVHKETPYTRLQIGRLTGWPDPNSIQAAGVGAGSFTGAMMRTAAEF